MKCPSCNHDQYEELPQLFKDAKMYMCLFCHRSFLALAVKVYEAPQIFQYLGKLRGK